MQVIELSYAGNIFEVNVPPQAEAQNIYCHYNCGNVVNDKDVVTGKVYSQVNFKEGLYMKERLMNISMEDAKQTFFAVCCKCQMRYKYN